MDLNTTMKNRRIAAEEVNAVLVLLENWNGSVATIGGAI
jgi:hypothetical protein